MRKLLLCILLGLPAAANAQPSCAHAEPRSLQLDLRGIAAVVFEVGPHDLRIDARPGSAASLQGRACASSAADLARLTLVQERAGDKLVVRLLRQGPSGGDLAPGHPYAWLDIEGILPDSVRVQLKVGSGDAAVTGAAALSADVGSGDVTVRSVRGLFTAAVDSGDIDARDVGALHVVKVGSGDVNGDQVRGPSHIDVIGSGDVSLKRTGGPVEIGSLGSGDVNLRDIGGDVLIGGVGSGDVEVQGVRGNLVVRSIGSGAVEHRAVSGRVDLPRGAAGGNAADGR